MERRIQKILLFIFLFIFIVLGVFIINFNFYGWNGNVVQAVSEDIKMDFEIVGNEAISKNGLFKIVVPDNGFEEWNKYIWENDILFSENIINISAKKDDVNMMRIFISKELDRVKAKDALKQYEIAAREGKYSRKVKEKVDDITVYYFERYNNIDTRKSYQFVIEKEKMIYYIEGNYRIGEEEMFKKVINQVIVSIKDKSLESAVK